MVLAVLLFLLKFEGLFHDDKQIIPFYFFCYFYEVKIH